jgi:hypothetical protein
MFATAPQIGLLPNMGPTNFLLQGARTTALPAPVYPWSPSTVLGFDTGSTFTLNSQIGVFDRPATTRFGTPIANRFTNLQPKQRILIPAARTLPVAALTDSMAQMAPIPRRIAVQPNFAPPLVAFGSRQVGTHLATEALMPAPRTTAKEALSTNQPTVLVSRSSVLYRNLHDIMAMADKSGKPISLSEAKARLGAQVEAVPVKTQTVAVEPIEIEAKEVAQAQLAVIDELPKNPVIAIHALEVLAAQAEAKESSTILQLSQDADMTTVVIDRIETKTTELYQAMDMLQSLLNAESLSQANYDAIRQAFTTLGLERKFTTQFPVPYAQHDISVSDLQRFIVLELINVPGRQTVLDLVHAEIMMALMYDPAVVGKELPGSERQLNGLDQTGANKRLSPTDHEYSSSDRRVTASQESGSASTGQQTGQ